MQEEINEILSRDSLDESDINFLMKNIEILPEEALVRLGLESVSTPVKEVVTEPTTSQKEVSTEVKPVSRGSKKVIK